MQHDSQPGVHGARLVAAALFGLGLLGMAPMAIAGQACGALQVSHAWVRVLPAAPVAGGFLQLHNPGDTAISLEAVSSPQFERVQMHRTRIDDDGMATMTPVDTVVVAAGQRVAFESGSYHLMMFKPGQPLAPGDSVTLELHCAGSDMPRIVTATVRSKMPMGQGHKAMKHGEPMKMHHGN